MVTLKEHSRDSLKIKEDFEEGSEEYQMPLRSRQVEVKRGHGGFSGAVLTNGRCRVKK